MIRHIVMFKLKPELKPAEKNIAIDKINRELLALKQKISQIRQWEIGINLSTDNPFAYDVVINSTFDSLEDLHAYQAHPDHLAFIHFNKDYSEHKVIIDYATGEVIPFTPSPKGAE